MRFLRFWLRLAWSYFSSARWPLAFTLLLGYALTGLAGLAEPWMNRQSGLATDALVTGDAAGFWRFQLLFVAVLLSQKAAQALGQWLIAWLRVDWRIQASSDLCRLLLGRQAYYRLQLDNPDQRIQEDVQRLVTASGAFLTLLFTLPPLVLGTGHALPAELLIPALALSLLNLAANLGLFAPILTRLSYLQEVREGDFRGGLIDLGERAESVAFLQAEAREQAFLSESFSRLLANNLRLIKWKSLLASGCNNLIMALPIALPLIVLVPRVLAGNLTVGELQTQAMNAATFLGALQFPLTLLPAFAGLFASVERLGELQDELTGHPAPPGILTIHAFRFASRDLRLDTPDGRTLFKGLDFVVEPGKRVLVTGPSGVGKSSLLRALAGLWQQGGGQLERPPEETVLFLAQRPYLVLGDVRDNLSYPAPADRYTDQELQDALRKVELSVRLDASPQALSPGEQQRLALARLLLARPDHAVLDEATSALAPEQEERLYRQLVALGCTLISVGHRPELAQFHTERIALGA